MPAALKRWVGQCDARITLRTNDCCGPVISFREYRGSWKQRSRMSIRPEAQKSDIKDRPSRIEAVCPIEGLEFLLIGSRGGFSVQPFCWNGVDVLG